MQIKSNNKPDGYAVPFDRRKQLKGTDTMFPILSPALGEYVTSTDTRQSLGTVTDPDEAGRRYFYGQFRDGSSIATFAGAVLSRLSGSQHYSLTSDLSMANAKGSLGAMVCLGAPTDGQKGWFLYDGPVDGLSVNGSQIKIRTDGNVGAAERLVPVSNNICTGQAASGVYSSGVSTFGVAYRADASNQLQYAVVRQGA